MSKETETTQNEQQQATAEAPKTTTATGTKTQASPEMQELLDKGYIYVSNTSPNELAATVQSLKSEAESLGYTISAGPIAKSGKAYIIRIDIIK